MLVFEGRFFHFEYEEADKELAGGIISIAEDTYEKVTARFQIPMMKDRFTFQICQDTAMFIKAAGKTAETYQPWMVGSADYARRFVCVLSPRVVSGRSWADMLKIVKHEVTHIAFDSLGDPDTACIGISEGIAVWAAGQIEPGLLQIDGAPSMVRLNEEDYFYENNGYQYSGVYAGYFLEKFGMEAFKKIYAGIERLDAYLYHGFEAEAIRNAKNVCSISIPDVMYFSSPSDLKTEYLSAEITGQVFMSPWIGISSLFIIDRFQEAGAWFQKILSEHNLKLLSSYYNIDYDEWWVDDSLLGSPLKEAHLRHNIEAFAHVPSLRSVSSGYIYKLDVSGIKEELKLYVTEDADRELVYTGKEKIPVLEKIPHTIQWELSYGGNQPHQSQPGKITARDLASGEVREVLSSDLRDGGCGEA